MTRYASPSACAPALRIAMLVANTGVGDARVMKQAESLVAAGHSVTVFCLAGNGLAPEDTQAGVRYVRLGEWHRGAAAAVSGGGAAPPPNLIRRLKTAAAPFIQHALHTATFTRPVAAFAPDVVHAHDFECLPAAVSAARRCGARVIYDMHELEEGRLPAAGPLAARWKAHIERSALRRVAATITVSHSIAAHTARKQGIPLPTVILNAPRLSTAAATQPGLRERCGLAASVPLAVYVGIASPGRGIEQLVAALALTPELHLAMLGPIRPALRPLLEREAARLGGRLHLLTPVPHDEVVAHIASADFGVATIPGSCLNYEYCLPNKLFEMTFAGLPVLVSRTTELQRFVAETGTGIAVDALDPAAIAQGLRAVYAARASLAPTGSKLEALRARFGWQRQAEHLIALYHAVARGPRGLPAAMARRALTASAGRPRHVFAVGN